jgi:ATP-dependent Clp protease adapter protein ClpS
MWPFGFLSSTPMSSTVIKPRIKVQTKNERPRLHKVILINADYTPRELSSA